MKNTLSTLLMLSLLLSACHSGETSAADESTNSPDSASSQTAVKPEKRPFVSQAELAHKREAFLSRHAISMDLSLWFGGTERFNGKLILATDGSKGRMESSDGRVQYYDGANALEVTAAGQEPGNRFAIYTWPYFMLFPYKLSDPGTIWQDYPEKALNGKNMQAEKLTFTAGTGDAPDDWYIAYTDTQRNLMQVAAYIVTAGGGSIEEAEEDPHAIGYADYHDVNGIPLAHHWDFYAWRAIGGLTDTLGYADLSNFKFLSADAEPFDIPANAFPLQ